MQNREIHIGHTYLEAVFHRATIPMNPLYKPNWEDQPSRFKMYPHVERIPLLVEPPPWPIPLSAVLTRKIPACSSGDFTIEKLSWLLYYAAGILNRRLDINWSSSFQQTQYVSALYGRGTPSGGGRYPTELYLCSGPGNQLLPGLYHYDAAHHALERLSTGNMTPYVHAATFHHPAAVVSNQFLLISLNFWKNAFKYGEFAYYLGTQDVGALLASLRILELALHIDRPFLLWYRDEMLNHLLGLETSQESVFAVIPLPAITQTDSTCSKGEDAVSKSEDTAYLQTELGEPKIRRNAFQHSKRILSFPHMQKIHQATLIDDEPLPRSRAIWETEYREVQVTGEGIELPRPVLERLHTDIFTLFQQRRSSSGRFAQQPAISRAELATLLYYGSRACLHPCDVYDDASRLHYTELMVIINHVEGIKRGVYFYDAYQHFLWATHTEELTASLQHHYGLLNYNLEQTGALIAVLGKPEQVLNIYGNRGCRIMNAEVGLVAQSIALVATALSLGSGIVAGFDHPAMDRIFGLQETGYRSLLFILVGHERQNGAHFDDRLV